MNLYHLTLQRPTSIYNAIYGNFSGQRIQEIAVSRGTVLELFKHDPNTGKLTSLLTVDTFGLIRSIMAFRLTGGQKVGSDSGRIVILEYDPTKNCFNKLHQETYGKTGCRRIVPGDKLAMDPKGRAVMITALEKQKFVYVFNRDSQARLTVSSPLEAHKSFTIVFDVVGVDVGFENPLFACLELDYEEADIYREDNIYPQPQHNLTLYELDLGLNHVVRKSVVSVPHFGNLLLSVPGGSEGPGGLLVFCENYVVYYDIATGRQISCLIPRRIIDMDSHERTLIIVSATTYKTKNLFFFLTQTEQGDLFKVTLELKDDVVSEVRMKYFDTIPVASALCVLKTGFLFCACEFGTHYFYQIVGLGEEDTTPEFSSDAVLEPTTRFLYKQHPLTNLLPVDSLDGVSPIIDCHVADLTGEDSPQLYLLQGRAHESSFCVLRHGLEVAEVAVSDLPGSPLAVWSLKRSYSDSFDSFIVVSFPNATLVLSLGETVEEVTDSGFDISKQTLLCGLLADDALIQIHSTGVRHVRSDGRTNEWTSGDNQITYAAMNDRQIVLTIGENEIVYFELDPNGQLNEYSERRELPSKVMALALGPVPPDQLRSRFLAVALSDHTVRMVSLDPGDCLEPISMQALPATAESLCVVETCFGDESSFATTALFLNIGLSNGVLLRTSLDTLTGDLSDTRARYLGSKPVKLFNVRVSGASAVLAVSSRAWLSYYHQRRYSLAPLTYPPPEYASALSSEHCSEGLVAVVGESLRILVAHRLGQVFHKTSLPLKYTPRKLLLEPGSRTFIVLESEYNALNTQASFERRNQVAEEIRQALMMTEEPKKINSYIKTFITENTTVPKSGIGTWASILRIIDPIRLVTLALYEFAQNDGVHCFTAGRFQGRPQDLCLVVGVSHGLVLNPRVSSGGSFFTFLLQIEEGCASIHLLHRTPLDEVPGAVLAFHGRLVAGVGNLLRVYDLGKQKLLRKCENKRIPSLITNIISVGHRLIVTDAQESFHFVKFKPYENQLIIFADDVIPRWVTAGCLLDYNTVAGADKFGNIFAIRLESDVKDDIDEDPTGIKSLWDRGLLNGAPQKSELIFNIHIGATANTLQKCALVPGGSEVLLYTTLSGSVGAFVPFSQKEDLDFMQHIELYLRQEMPSIVGRDPLSYRSYYFPLKVYYSTHIKSVIDGDCCEQFNALPLEKKQRVADELDRTPQEVSKKLEDMRTKCAF